MANNEVSLTWHTKKDDNVCPICKAIDGYKWIFTSEVPDSLIHPVYGEVWNTQMGSLAHEHKLGKAKYGIFPTCRCHVEGKVESLAGLAEEVRRIKEELQAALGEQGSASDTKSGQYRRTTPEDIGIDLSKYGIE
jgi:hypothetical protein